MTRHLICLTGLACLLFATAFAHAGEAGRIVYVAGQAKIANHVLNLGDKVHEGDEIQTGADGYVYLQTVDNGFLILRPGSRARVVNYHIDRNEPKNTRIKLELLNGVARSISGEAVKEARQNFRFNTPVAAIGVRGTDFTVFTDAETSKVAVISGGIVVAGFAGSCGPEGSGPCEGQASRELFANQIGQMLQVKRGQATPQMLPSTVTNVEAGAKAEELLGKTGVVPGGVEFSLDPQKTANLPRPANVPEPVPPLVENKPPVVPPKEIIWGRWRAVLDMPRNLDPERVKNADTVGINDYFALYVAKSGAAWTVPERGGVAFVLKDGQAVVTNEVTKQVSAAALENARLQFDFAAKTYTTGFDLKHGDASYAFASSGPVLTNGRFGALNGFGPGQNMAVDGVLGPENSAAYYLFSGRLDGSKRVAGATQWGK